MEPWWSPGGARRWQLFFGGFDDRLGDFAAEALDAALRFEPDQRGAPVGRSPRVVCYTTSRRVLVVRVNKG